MPSRSSMLLQQHHHAHAHAHELLGPRPAPLKLTKAADQVSKKRRPAQQQQPVIIYVESPKVIHAHPSEFKSVVQRLTGAPPPSSAAPLLPPPLLQQFPFQLYGQLGGPLDDRTLPLLASSVPPASYSSLPPDAASTSLGGYFGNDQLTRPPFLFDHDNMVTVAAAAATIGSSSDHQASLLVSGDPFLAPPPAPLAACYHGGLFVNQH